MTPEKPHKVIAILQPGYLPWLGFFEQMAYADLFVYLDNVQYTKQDWRNRNRIKYNQEPYLLSVPIQKCHVQTWISEVKVAYAEKWHVKHLNVIQQSYRKTPYFDVFYPRLEHVLHQQYDSLQALDIATIDVIREYLGIHTPIAFASEIPECRTNKNERLLDICSYFNATTLYDGKAAASFIDEDLFLKHGMDVVFQDYQHPQYPQTKGEFASHLSTIDLIFNAGPESLDILLSSPSPTLSKHTA